MRFLLTSLFIEWISGNRAAIAQWDYGVTAEDGSTTKKRSSPESSTLVEDRRRSSKKTESKDPTAAGGIAYHRVYRQTQLLWSETGDQTDYGYWYWATDNVAGLTYQSGADTDVRPAFINSGALANTQDTNYRAINDDFPTFGFAVDLGSVEATPVSTLFTIGLTQEQAIQFDGATGDMSVPSLWTSYFPTELDAVSQPPPLHVNLVLI